MNILNTQKISPVDSKVITIPVRTWSWLHVNETTVTTIQENELHEILKIKAAEAVTIKNSIVLKEELLTLCDQKAEQAYEEQFQKKGVATYTIEIPENQILEEAIRITTQFDTSNRASIEDLVIYAGKNSQATIYLEGFSMEDERNTIENSLESSLENSLESSLENSLENSTENLIENSLKYYHLGRIRLILEEGAHLNMVKAEFYSKDTSHQEIFGAVLKEKAVLNMIDSPLGSKGAAQNWNIILEGRESEVSMDLLYVGDGDKRLDFTSRIEFCGEKTRGELRTKGILLGNSRKILRDTLDFVSGSKGSVGKEVEDVLLLSSKVRNLSVPLLLCGEDDVVGEHAATSGKSDDRVLFYLMSRGLSEEEAKLLLAESKFTGVLDQIEDEFIRNEMIQYLRRAMKKEALH